MRIITKRRTVGWLQPPAGTEAGLLAYSLNINHLFNFAGEILPCNSINGQSVLADPNASGRVALGAGGYGLGVTPTTNSYTRITISNGIAGTAAYTLLYVISINNAADSGKRTLSTSKNQGGTTTSNFANQYLVAIYPLTMSIFATNGAEVWNGTQDLDNALTNGVNVIAVSVENAIESKVVVNGSYKGTIASQDTALWGINSLGNSRYGAGAIYSSVPMHMYGTIPYVLSVSEMISLTTNITELFNTRHRRYFIPSQAFLTATSFASRRSFPRSILNF